MSVQNEIQRLSAAKASIAASLQAMGAEPPQGTTLDQYAAQLAAIASAAPWLPLAGGTMEGALDMGGHRLSNLPAPQQPADAVRKQDLEAAGGKATRLRISVPPSAWSGNYATLGDDFFQTGNFVYLLSPDTNHNSSIEVFANAGITAYCVTNDGKLDLEAKAPPTGTFFAVITKIPTENGNGNVYCSSGFWIDESAIYDNVSEMIPKSAVFVSSSTEIPAGRMVGDVNGDGQITNDDYLLASQILSGSVTPTEIERGCADIDGNGSVNSSDMLTIQRLVSGFDKLGEYSRDILGNWSNNPDYATDEAQFYIDISVSGLTTGSDIAIAVQGDGADQIVRVEARDGAFRVYAKLLPVNPLPYKLLQ